MEEKPEPVPTIQIHQPTLKAVSRFMSHSDIRYYLNGVCVEANKTHTVIVATDGRCILAVRQKAGNTVKHGARVLIPDEVVKLLIKGTSRTRKEFELQQRGDNLWAGWMIGSSFNQCLEFRGIEAKYPNWRGVIQKMLASGKPEKRVQLNPKYLMRFFDAYHDIKGKGSKIGVPVTFPVAGSSASGNALVVMSPPGDDLDFAGILMGVKTYCSDEKLRDDAMHSWVAAAEVK